MTIFHFSISKECRYTQLLKISHFSSVLHMTTLLIFDIWGTIIEHGLDKSPSKEAKRILKTKNSFQEFITTFQSTMMTKPFSSLEEAFKKAAKDLGTSIPNHKLEELIGMWNKNALLSHMYEEVKDEINNLKEDYQVVLLANIDKPSYEKIRDKYALEELFHNVYKSFEVGYTKGDKKFFEHILSEEDVEASEAVMIGDSIKSDIESSAQSDIKGILVDRRDTRTFEPKVNDLTQLKTFL